MSKNRGQFERVAKFNDLLGYREITLKSGTDPAIIAFRNRVAEICKAEVTTEDAVIGDKESNGFVENAVMAESEPAAPAAQDLREVPIQPDPNPKGRLLRKSASSPAAVDSKVRRGHLRRIRNENWTPMGNGHW